MSDFEEWFLSNGIPLDTDFNVAKRAFEAAWQARVPEGYVVVPKEPTDIEIESIKEKHWSMRGCQLCKSDYIDLYKAMIEAVEK